MKLENDLQTDNWETSYSRKDNFIYYPKDEVVKFINRFVRKRNGIDLFTDIIGTGSVLKGLDLGCGIGRQTILMEEFKMHGYGVDISAIAIKEAKSLARSFGYEMDSRFVVLTENSLPFKNDFFDFAISDSVLDSMYFKFAKTYIKELDRTVKKLVYLNLISGESVKENFSEDVLVTTMHEEGTIQSYYNTEKINNLIEGTNWKVKQLNTMTECNLLSAAKRVRYHIVLSK